MPNKSSILFASGDIGGAQALLPLIDYAYNNNYDAHVLRNGYLGSKLAFDSKYLYIDVEDSEAIIAPCFYIFTSSLIDSTPLRLGRYFASKGVKVIHVLDSWCNYAERLRVDGMSDFTPKYYTVMDDIAYKGAIRNNINSELLIVTGHTAYANMLPQTIDDSYVHLEAPINEKKKILFVSEPISYDQPRTDKIKYRGYTEFEVLDLVCSALRPYSNDIQLIVAPHPREDRSLLIDRLSKHKKSLTIILNNNHTVMGQLEKVDGVIGMASVVLYESWLLGLPTMSIQPNLLKHDLSSFRGRKQMIYVQDENKIPKSMKLFLRKITTGSKFPQNEIIANNRNSVKNIFGLINEK